MPRILDWWLRDRATGRIVVGQFPNGPLWLFMAAALVALPSEPAGATGAIARICASASLFVWAGDELVRGVNPWRRLLGAGTLAYLGCATLGLVPSAVLYRV